MVMFFNAIIKIRIDVFLFNIRKFQFNFNCFNQRVEVIYV